MIRDDFGSRVIAKGAPSASSAHSLEAVFNPRSVAVVGVTATPGTVPFDIFQNILVGGFKGKVFPVAPGKRSICEVPAYRYVVDIDEPVDLAVIVFPAEVVDRALEQCGKKGIKAAIVISAGFREVGPEGARREERLKAIAAEYGIALVGPNCLGGINTDPEVQLNASFARKMPHVGRIGFLSQSGALCTAVLDYAREKGIGFSKFISFGNKAGVTEIDLLEYLHEDKQTDVILLYLEELRDGRRLMEVAQRITRGPRAKPILAIKAGRTPQGADAAASHTGSLAAEDAVCEGVFLDSGILRVRSVEELFNSATMYVYQPMPAGNRLAIVTNAGGPGVMATDAAIDVGLAVPRLSDSTMAKLRAVLPATANVKNPVDVIGDARAERYMAALETVLDDAEIDQALVILTPQSMTNIEAIAQGICRIEERATKPIACSFMGATDVAIGVHLLQEAHIPHYILPEWACRAMADVQRIRHWRAQPPDKPEPMAVDRAAAEAIVGDAPPGYLDEEHSLAVLAAYGLPVPEYQMCRSAKEAVLAAGEVGYPVVLRATGPHIVHKTELGAVALDLRCADEVRAAYERMTEHLATALPGDGVRGVLVRPMIPAGREVILGARRDPSFGPLVMFGIGGVMVELLGDVTFGLAPLGRAAAARMIQRVKAYRMLEAFRGAPVADVPAVEDALMRVAQLIVDLERIFELDVNPLIVGPFGAGCSVADVRIRLR